MNSIQTVKTWPNDAVVEAIEGKIAKVYEVKTVGTANGPKTIQNAELQDASGNKIRLAVWEHPDLKPLEGKDIALHSTRGGTGKFGGVKVVHGSYVAKKDGNGHKAGDSIPTLELSVSKSGAFQLIEVYRANTGTTAPAPAQAGVPLAEPAGVPTRQASIHGATVGAAINNACANLTARGEDLDPKKVYIIASALVKVALHMESGKLHEPKTKEQESHDKLANVSDKPDEEAPF